jgi:probable phosphoglycerate mutase
MTVPERDPAEEFEAVWAVVRRLEAHIRRLEATVGRLQAQLAAQAGERSDPGTEPAGGPTPIPVDLNEEDSASTEVVSPIGAAGPGTYRLTFDGGSLGNPGHGYGSYHVASPRGGTLHERLDFSDQGERVTNNQAEYLTLIRALERLQEVLGERAPAVTLEIRGDSQLVVNQLNGRWKVRNAELQTLYERARQLLSAFGRIDLRWHERSHSVEVLGH